MRGRCDNKFLLVARCDCCNRVLTKQRRLLSVVAQFGIERGLRPYCHGQSTRGLYSDYSLFRATGFDFHSSFTSLKFNKRDYDKAFPARLWTFTWWLRRSLAWWGVVDTGARDWTPVRAQKRALYTEGSGIVDRARISWKPPSRKSWGVRESGTPFIRNRRIIHLTGLYLGRYSGGRLKYFPTRI